ncbi:NADP-dependent oxidoreductase [Nocardia sp. NPDC050712]|uniref:NADP-dependent oxidoreductase n=1 Tax=Nocardia sp. NPDC050712 TaxID=3155518 RepID=UPI0033D80FF1
MRAIAFDEFGGPEVLRPVEIPVPEPTGDQVRVAVRAAAVNASDWKTRSGILTFGDNRFPQYPGWEVAGTVDALGPDARGFAVGDEVFGWTQAGGYAEYALSSALARKPAGLDWADAVALPIAVNTAAKVLAMLRVRAGETLLVNGASGVVGSMAVQLAVAAGVTVIGTACERNQDLVRALGAIPTTYGDGLADRVWALAPHGVDAVFDTAQHGGLPAAIALRGDTGRIIAIADFAAAQLGVVAAALHGVDAVYDAFRCAESVVGYSGTWLGESAADCPPGRPLVDLAGKVAEDIRSGKFRLAGPARTFRLEHAALAHQEMEHGHGTGKVVLLINRP